MKDEEKAEEYAKKEWEPYDLDEKVAFSITVLIRTYLAGLHEGQPKWHDLRKDPNDLPENKRKVWCDYYDDCGKGFYDKDNGEWCIEGHLYCSSIHAWCEIPTFDKEIEK